jgi:hypothetical protein
MGHDHGLHATAAHLIDGCSRDTQRQTCAKGGLPRGSLAQASGQDTTHNDLINLIAT